MRKHVKDILVLLQILRKEILPESIQQEKRKKLLKMISDLGEVIYVEAEKALGKKHNELEEMFYFLQEVEETLDNTDFRIQDEFEWLNWLEPRIIQLLGKGL